MQKHSFLLLTYSSSLQFVSLPCDFVLIVIHQRRSSGRERGKIIKAESFQLITTSTKHHIRGWRSSLRYRFPAVNMHVAQCIDRVLFVFFRYRRTDLSASSTDVEKMMRWQMARRCQQIKILSVAIYHDHHRVFQWPCTYFELQSVRFRNRWKLKSPRRVIETDFNRLALFPYRLVDRSAVSRRPLLVPHFRNYEFLPWLRKNYVH